MLIRRGIFFNILLAFAIFALGLGLAMGIAGYFSARVLSMDFLAKRSSLLLTALLQAERHALSGKDEPQDTRELIATLNLDFLVGKEVDAAYARLADGIHLVDNGESYVYIQHIDGVPYVISGSISAKESIQQNIGFMFLLCGASGLLVAILLSIFLAALLSRPLRSLARTLEASDPAKPCDLPQASRSDEIGLLARAIANYQQDAASHIEREKLFAGAASHELRTPLTVLGQGLEILEARSSGDKQAEGLILRLKKTTDNMTGVVASLLALARGEKQELASIDPGQILKETLENLCMKDEQGRADQNERNFELATANFKLRINTEITQVKGSRELAATVFRNLLENALRHGDGSGIQLRLEADFLEITNKAGEEKGSSGFGLLIVERACERMGWRLERTDAANAITFRVRFNQAG